MSDNSRLFKEKLRRELIEKHVRGIEHSNLLSLKLQERLIGNEGKLDKEVIQKVQSFLRPCDLEEISIERSDRGKCGWIQCETRISSGSTTYLKSKWALDKVSGNIIDRSVLSLFCSINCYYLYLDLSITLSETHPHLRTNELAEIQKWLNLDQIEEQVDKETTLSDGIQVNKEKTINPCNYTQNDSSLNKASENCLKKVNEDQEVSNYKEEETTKGVNTKGPAELANLLESIRIFRNSNTQFKFNQIVKQFDYLDIEESDPLKSYESNNLDSMDQKSNETFLNNEVPEYTNHLETQDDKKSEQSDELNDPNYTYQSMMQVLQDISEEEEEYDQDDEYSDSEDENENVEKDNNKNEKQETKNERLRKGNQKSCGGDDYILLMTQFYDNLSPEVVVLDLLTSLISEETRDLIKSNCIVENSKNIEKEESNEKINEFNTIQIDRRNVLKDILSEYIISIEWISHTKLLVFTIYRILDTFVFPFSIPNLKESCLELLTLILIDIILDHEINFKITNYFESLDDEIRAKAEEWILEIRGKYDKKFIDNIKLLFISKD